MAEGQVGVPSELLRERCLKLMYPALPQPDERNAYHPGAYVRWTIKKDMQLFLKLLKEGRIQIPI